MPPGGAVPVRTASRIDVRVLTAAGWAVAAAVTVVILETPYLRFAYHSPELHLVLDSVDSCVALLLAYLLVGRFRRTHRLQDLVLTEGLLLLAAAGLGLALFIDVLGAETRQSLGVWLPASLRLMAAGLIAVAAALGTTPVRAGGTRLGVALPAAMVLATMVTLWLLRDQLPIAVSQTAPESSQRPVIRGHPALIAGQGLAAACFLYASVSFTRQARERPEEVLRWLGPACALAGFARINYVLFPSLYSGWLYSGDVLRTAAYACLLVGATREISRYWSGQTQVAVLEDRRRLARELHDGVVQELSWIKSETRALSTTLPEPPAPAPPGQSRTPVTQPILDACDRALDEARAAVDALGRDSAEPLGYQLHRAAREVAARYGGRVAVDLDDAVEADQGHRHDLARITREAVGNAFRHGRASCVQVVLKRTSTSRRLVVQDDGGGFDVALTTDGSGFGLTSMRERAEALPGVLEVRSTPGRGTTVEVTW